MVRSSQPTGHSTAQEKQTESGCTHPYQSHLRLNVGQCLVIWHRAAPDWTVPDWEGLVVCIFHFILSKMTHFSTWCPLVTCVIATESNITVSQKRVWMQKELFIRCWGRNKNENSIFSVSSKGLCVTAKTAINVMSGACHCVYAKDWEWSFCLRDTYRINKQMNEYIKTSVHAWPLE